MQIIYRNILGEQIIFGQQPPFLVTAKKGFGGVENLITTQQQYGLDGSALVNQQLADRNPEIEGEFLAPDSSTLQTMRNQFSSILNPKLAGTLTYQPGNGKVYEIDVLVAQPPILDNPEDNLAQTYIVKFLALDSYWIDKSQADKLVPLSSVKKNLTFPLRIVPGFTFADISSNNIQTVDNNGDVAVGMTITLQIRADVVNPKVLNVETGEFFRLEATYPAGTTLIINTMRGQKKVDGIHPDGSMFNALEDWDEDSVFLQLARGTNFFQLQADQGSENMLGTIKFSPKAIGV